MTVRNHEQSSETNVRHAQEPTCLTPGDQPWLEVYGVDPQWMYDPVLRQSLNDTIITGSLRLDEPVNEDKWQDVVSARRSFLEFIGLSAGLVDSYEITQPTLIPLDTFIRTQRTMHSFGLDAPRLVNAMPSAIGYASESVREKMDNYTALGIDAVKLVNASHSAISFAPESVREKMDNYTALGIDAVKLVNASPSAIGYAPESVREKMDNYTALGIDAVKLVNAMPQAIGLAPESVREKMDNYTALGIDAVKLVNAMPSAIGYAPESVRNKIEFLRRSVKLLKWEYSPEQLVNTYPAILGFNTKKLSVLRRIAAVHLDLNARTVNPNTIRSSLIIPLEKYIIAISQLQEEQTIPLSKLFLKARNIKLDSSDRKELAVEVAPSLGRIGVVYLDYR